MYIGTFWKNFNVFGEIFTNCYIKMLKRSKHKGEVTGVNK